MLRKTGKKLANQLVICYLRDRHTITKFDKNDQKFIDVKSRLERKGLFFKERIMQALRYGNHVDEDISELSLKIEVKYLLLKNQKS